MQLHPYLNFAGKCKQAFQYYEKHLGGKILTMMTHAQAPDQTQMAPDWKDAILYANMNVAGTQLMGSDVKGAEPMRSAYLSLTVNSNEEAERLYKALGEGGQVFTAMTETFFAHRFGVVRDQFGMNWMILHQKPMQ